MAQRPDLNAEQIRLGECWSIVGEQSLRSVSATFGSPTSDAHIPQAPLRPGPVSTKAALDQAVGSISTRS